MVPIHLWRADPGGQSSKQHLRLCLLVAALGCTTAGYAGPTDSLRLSVYCTAGDVQRYLATATGREQALHAMEPLRISALFLEGRRGDEYVPPAQLREARDFFAARKIECRGGIATVPGATFGARQNADLGWLNWESPKTRADVAGFFAEDAPLFDEIIVDDFFCTGDTSTESAATRGARSWGQYRRDLLVSLVQPLMLRPTKAAHPHTRLIVKFPQWYDRFQLFGYDPPRLAAQFEEVWVGTEVRNPYTRRMGFVQPTEGYMNFRWLAAQAGDKVRGAWFDHIECSAEQFFDQAAQSVLAGASELTVFHLGDVMEGHPGDALLAARLAELQSLAQRLRGQKRRGIAYYKPAGSEGDENLYLADYLGIIGLPILPEARYPLDSSVAVLPVQAAADPRLLERLRLHLRRGATVVLTPALVRAIGPTLAGLTGITTGAQSEPSSAPALNVGGLPLALDTPLEVDGAIEAGDCEVRMTAMFAGRAVPFLTSKSVGHGRLMVLNVRTFSERDFSEADESLLAPKPLGLSDIPQRLADAIRAELSTPLGVEFRAPAWVTLHLLGKDCCAYNCRDAPVRVQVKSQTFEIPPHKCIWIQ